MNKFSLDSGRQSQKKKTRQNIISSTQELMSKGTPFSLEDVAEHSNTSRATVYRYFSNIDILCSEAVLDIQTKPTDKLVEECEHLPLSEQILYIQNYFNQLAINNEVAFRKYLSVYLKDEFSEDKSSLRGARRTAALHLILSPFKKKLGEETYTKLIVSACTLMGFEPLIVTKDVCGLDSKSSKEYLSWSLEMLLKGCGVN